MKWAIVGYCSSSLWGILGSFDDELSAHRARQILSKRYTNSYITVLEYQDLGDLEGRCKAYLTVFGFSDLDNIPNLLADTWSPLVDDGVFDFVKTVESRSAISALPGEDGYSTYIRFLDNIILNDWDMVEEIETGLMEGDTPVIIQKYENLLSDLYFRRNYLRLNNIRI